MATHCYTRSLYSSPSFSPVGPSSRRGLGVASPSPSPSSSPWKAIVARIYDFIPPHPPSSSSSSSLKKLNSMGARSSSNRRAALSAEKLNEGIAEFYDSTSGLWEDVWGEHMHHGFYDPSLSPFQALTSDHNAAQIRMIEETLAWAEDGRENPTKILDVGCGIGGSSRFLAKKYGADVKGITLSPRQVKRATELTSLARLSNKVSFEVADALDQPFPDDQFDLIWSMESGEHMPDKEKFLRELVRVTKPGGKIIIVTWCHRDLLPGETSLQPSEQDLLNRICDAYYLPAWCSPSDYVHISQKLNLKGVKSEDWTKHITPFWPAVIASAFTFKGLTGLVKTGWTGIRGALAMALMVQGYNSGLIKFALITGHKEENN